METVNGVLLMCGSSVLVAMFVMSLITNLSAFVRKQLLGGDGD